MRHSPNILMIAVDDLRTLLGCYGVGWIRTPHLDALAARGVVLARNYCQFPICGPSRASLLSGVRPTPTRFRKWNARIDEDLPQALTLPAHFARNGYATACVGKVTHDLDDHRAAWTGACWRPEDQVGASPGAYAAGSSHRTILETKRFPPYEDDPVEDSVYGDALIAERAIQEVRALAAADPPFFLAAGFLRPHLPFNAPRRYWDLYDRDALPIAPNASPPEAAPAVSLTNWEELRKYAGMPAEGPLAEAQARALIHGYAASISYLDAQVGALLTELEVLQLQENTIVVLWADHGWQLGEHGFWSKHTLYEPALRTPLIFSGPGVPRGQISAGLSENLDVYPTLCELAGLPIPNHASGRSLVAQLRDPHAAGADAVFTRHGQGDSVKTDRYRYSEWRDEHGAVTDRMLYDHQVDPGENRNVAEHPAYGDVVSHHSALLAELYRTYGTADPSS